MPVSIEVNAIFRTSKTHFRIGGAPLNQSYPATKFPAGVNQAARLIKETLSAPISWPEQTAHQP